MMPASTLQQGLQRLGLAASGAAAHVADQLAARLLAYAQLIDRANRAYGLVRADLGQLVSHHLLDCLAAVPHLARLHGVQTVLDIGSGAGLPGIPLALAQPQWQVTLVERSTRRATFLQLARDQLQLPNLTVIAGDAIQLTATFDLVTFRAVAPLGQLLDQLAQLAAAGRVLGDSSVVGAYQGTADGVRDQLAATGAGGRREVIPLAVPGLDAERHLVLVHGPWRPRRDTSQR